MIFFTDITTDASKYCLLNIKRYSDLRKYEKLVVFVDPSVYELTKSTEFSMVDEMHSMLKEGALRRNEYISIDYPDDY